MDMPTKKRRTWRTSLLLIFTRLFSRPLDNRLENSEGFFGRKKRERKLAIPPIALSLRFPLLYFGDWRKLVGSCRGDHSLPFPPHVPVPSKCLRNFFFPKEHLPLLYFLFFHCCPSSSFFLFLLPANHPFPSIKTLEKETCQSRVKTFFLLGWGSTLLRHIF